MNLVVGTDLGTQGARAVAVTRAGALLASSREALLPQPQPPGQHAQEAETWWKAVCNCLRQLGASLPPDTTSDGLAVTSTSGTIVPLDERGRPKMLWFAREFADDDPAALDREAAALLPTALIRYPLVRHGERFPFRHAQATGFCLGEPHTRAELFAAGLEGLALIERLAYDTLATLGATIDEPIYVTGGAARLDSRWRARRSAKQPWARRCWRQRRPGSAASKRRSARWCGSNNSSNRSRNCNTPTPKNTARLLLNCGGAAISMMTK